MGWWSWDGVWVCGVGMGCGLGKLVWGGSSWWIVKLVWAGQGWCLRKTGWAGVIGRW